MKSEVFFLVYSTAQNLMHFPIVQEKIDKKIQQRRHECNGFKPKGSLIFGFGPYDYHIIMFIETCRNKMCIPKSS